jgi:acyl dehydratase
MPLNKALVGKEYPKQEYKVAKAAFQAYAKAYNEPNAAFFSADPVAPPQFAVVYQWMAMGQPMFDVSLHGSEEQQGKNLMRLLHGEQDLTYLKPVKDGDTITSTPYVHSIEEKESGDILRVGIKSVNQKGETVTDAIATMFIRGKSKGAGAGAPAPEAPRGAPDFTYSQKIDPDQTVRYAEASGDHNPIHVDPNMAMMAGLPGIIVHGLCTMAIASKGVIDKAAGGDPTKLKRFKVRFSKPVLPEQTITVEAWKKGQSGGVTTYDFVVKNDAGEEVVKDGVAEIAG